LPPRKNKFRLVCFFTKFASKAFLLAGGGVKKICCFLSKEKIKMSEEITTLFLDASVIDGYFDKEFEQDEQL